MAVSDVGLGLRNETGVQKSTKELVLQRLLASVKRIFCLAKNVNELRQKHSFINDQSLSQHNSINYRKPLLTLHGLSFYGVNLMLTEHTFYMYIKKGTRACLPIANVIVLDLIGTQSTNSTYPIYFVSMR